MQGSHYDPGIPDLEKGQEEGRSAREGLGEEVLEALGCIGGLGMGGMGELGLGSLLGGLDSRHERTQLSKLRERI